MVSHQASKPEELCGIFIVGCFNLLEFCWGNLCGPTSFVRGILLIYTCLSILVFNRVSSKVFAEWNIHASLFSGMVAMAKECIKWRMDKQI